MRDHDVAVVGSDNAPIECIPFDKGVFLGVHIGTTVLDQFAPISLKDAFIPFTSAYRPI